MLCCSNFLNQINDFLPEKSHHLHWQWDITRVKEKLVMVIQTQMDAIRAQREQLLLAIRVSLAPIVHRPLLAGPLSTEVAGTALRLPAIVSPASIRNVLAPTRPRIT